MKLTDQKRKYLENLSDENGFISALAIDQRGALKKMLNKHQASEATAEQIKEFKVLVSKHLTKYSSSILLDPEYGLDAAKARDKNAGLLLAYEKTGYDANAVGRLPDCLVDWSAKRLKEEGADAVKFLLYYDVDESDEINNQKRAYMERVGAECVAEDIPFFLEILSYNYKDADNSTAEFAKLKPRKVIEAMKEAALRNASYAYAQAIMKDWLKRGINTIEKVNEARALFERKKSLQSRSHGQQVREEVVPEFLKAPKQQNEVAPPPGGYVNPFAKNEEE